MSSARSDSADVGECGRADPGAFSAFPASRESTQEAVQVRNARVGSLADAAVSRFYAARLRVNPPSLRLDAAGASAR